jgi:uncharacterized protein YcbX
MGSVVAVWRYPVKSARGEQLRTVAVDPGGVRGDRAWACLDAGDGTVGSAKHPRRWGGLLQVSATGDDEVTVGVGGRSARAGSDEADELLSEHLGVPRGSAGSCRRAPGCTGSCPRTRAWSPTGWVRPPPARSW